MEEKVIITTTVVINILLLLLLLLLLLFWRLHLTVSVVYRVGGVQNQRAMMIPFVLALLYDLP